MYVIADIEWVENNMGIKSPTQLAALRVDLQWNVIDRFESFIQPMDKSFYNWEHVAYNGGSAEEFLAAPVCRKVFSDFDEWLGEDTLLWWFSPARDTYEQAVRLFQSGGRVVRGKILSEYATVFLYGKAKRISSYKLAEKRGVACPVPEHYAVNDAELILLLIRNIGFPQCELDSLLEAERRTRNTAEYNQGAYQYSVADGVWHQRGCALLAPNAEVVGSDSLNACLREKGRGCSCVRKELSVLRRERTDDIINRSTFTFGYAEGGGVFHHYTCKLLRNAKSVLGCVTYQKVIEKGLRPCRVCNPSPRDGRRPGVPYKKEKPRLVRTVSGGAASEIIKKRKPRKADVAVNRPLSEEEYVALNRLRQAQRERLSGEPTSVLMEKEKEDFYTLTQPRFAFFAAKGYRTFHLRSCSKLSGIIGVKGFEAYESARKAGFKPCKNCKPSPKQNISVSIPIYNEVRENESVPELTLCCVKLGYEYSVEERRLHVCTPVGKWILNLIDRPVTVEHINLVKEPNATVYHRQPRIFLSLIDALRYIYRHDATLQGVPWDANAI